MAGKARRRPSWKVKRDGWTLVLLDEKDDSNLESIFMKTGSKQIKRLIQRYGRDYIENKLSEIIIGNFKDIIERRTGS